MVRILTNGWESEDNPAILHDRDRSIIEADIADIKQLSLCLEVEWCTTAKDTAHLLE